MKSDGSLGQPIVLFIKIFLEFAVMSSWNINVLPLPFVHHEPANSTTQPKLFLSS